MGGQGQCFPEKATPSGNESQRGRQWVYGAALVGFRGTLVNEPGEELAVNRGVAGGQKLVQSGVEPCEDAEGLQIGVRLWPHVRISSGEIYDSLPADMDYPDP